jgi:hypothetical protein
MLFDFGLLNWIYWSLHLSGRFTTAGLVVSHGGLGRYPTKVSKRPDPILSCDMTNSLSSLWTMSSASNHLYLLDELVPVTFVVPSLKGHKRQVRKVAKSVCSAPFIQLTVQICTGAVAAYECNLQPRSELSSWFLSARLRHHLIKDS